MALEISCKRTPTVSTPARSRPNQRRATVKIENNGDEFVLLRPQYAANSERSFIYGDQTASSQQSSQ